MLLQKCAKSANQEFIDSFKGKGAKNEKFWSPYLHKLRENITSISPHSALNYKNVVVLTRIWILVRIYVDVNTKCFENPLFFEIAQINVNSTELETRFLQLENSGKERARLPLDKDRVSESHHFCRLTYDIIAVLHFAVTF